MEMHKIWITSGADYNLRTWGWSEKDLKLNEENMEILYQKNLFKAHLQQITEVLEITTPKLIVSSSLDGNIKLWDINEQERSLIAELKEPGKISKGNFFFLIFIYSNNI